jgi:hypothetical protein
MQSQVAPSTGTSAGVTSNALVKGGLSPFAYRGLLPAARPNRRPSWISPDARIHGKGLLYVSNLGTADVTIYSYKLDGKTIVLSGTITGFSEPGVPCSDSAGDVFVPDYGTAQVYEYAHGATTPKQVLSDTSGSPVSCSVDPTTGDLAVANFGASQPSGNVAVFPGAAGSPTTIATSNVTHPAFVGYTNKGVLYTDGIDGSSAFQMAAMPNASGSFSAVTISGGTIVTPGAIQWGGQYLLVGDQTYQGQSTSAVYQMCICTTNSLSVHGVAPIVGSTDVVGFWKRGKGPTTRIIAPDYGNPANGVIIYDPNKEQTTGNITDSISQPVGATISQKGLAP